MTLSLPLIEAIIIVSLSQLQLVTQGGGRHSSAPIPKMGVNSGDNAELSVALFMGDGAITVCMLGTKTPAARPPERALLLNMVGAQLIALEAIGKLEFASSTPLA